MPQATRSIGPKTESARTRFAARNLDGTGVEDLVTSGLNDPGGIALDVAAGKMYWVDTDTFKIQRADLDGGNVEDLVTGLGGPRRLKLDLFHGKMYWTDDGPLTNTISRANLDGSSVEDIVTTGLIAPAGMEIDPQAGKIYWTDFGTDKLQMSNLDGTNVEDMITTGLNTPVGLALGGSSTNASLSAAIDTYIDSGAVGDNYGSSTSLVVDQSGGNIGNQRALLQFDFSSIPVGATITGATLRMESTNNTGAFDINIYELTETWVEGAGNGTADVANWSDRNSSNAWGSAGGSYDPTVIATVNTDSTGQHAWDLTSLVQAWYTGNKVNNGIIIGSPDTGTETITYDSSEGVTAPALEISYSLAANALPTVASGGVLSYTEGDGQVLLDSDITVGDPDGTLQQAAIQISANHTSTEDVLHFTNQNGIVGNFNATTGILLLSGPASVADYQTALRSIEYENTSVNPNSSLRIVTIQVDDGSSVSSTSRMIDITQVGPLAVDTTGDWNDGADTSSIAR